MKAIVTGGAGFIGSNIVDLLVKLNYDVTVIDNLSTGKIKNINKKANLKTYDLASPYTESTINFLKKQFKNSDVVFHTAALPRVEPSIVNPTSSHSTNIDGTYNVFWAAKCAGVKNIVFSSSSSVYGEAKNHPTNENEPTDPMSPYALQKLVNEQYAKLFCKLYDMNITCLRYFNCYGNREPTEGSYIPVIGIWLKQLKNGKPLTITGDGKQMRDFVNVSDVAQANVDCFEKNLKGFNVFNVGSNKAFELNYLARLIADNISYIDPRIEPRYTLADISALHKATGWLPKVKIEDYISSKIGEMNV